MFLLAEERLEQGSKRRVLEAGVREAEVAGLQALVGLWLCPEWGWGGAMGAPSSGTTV